jgi:hypothetical protein
VLADAFGYTPGVESRVHHQSEQFLVASAGPVVVWITGMAVNNEDFMHVRAVFDGPLAKAPKTALLMVLKEGTKMPEMGARKAAADMIEAIGDRFVGMHVVLRGSGFWASALRSAITGLAMLVRRKQSALAYSTVEEASKEIATLIPDVSASELTSAVERLLDK